MNRLTADERDAGWRLLFDGETLSGWRSVESMTPPSGWQVVGGELYRASEGGDLVSADQFDDFELRLEWKLPHGGNSGIFFRAPIAGPEIWRSAPELQLLDNAGHPDGRTPETSAGANYGLHAPLRDVTRPAGAWNDVRLVASGAHVEHWMNGVRVVAYELWSDDWVSRVRASKFRTQPTYGRARRGHLALQDHGDRVWFRAIRVRVLARQEIMP